MELQDHYTDTFEGLLLISLSLPLLSSLVSWLISDRYSWAVSFMASLLMLVSAITSALVSFQVWGNTPYEAKWSWFSVGGHTFSAGVLLNQQAALLLFLVSFISFLVHMYSTGYMAADNSIRKYFSVLGFFTFSMLALAVSDNLLVIFCFWELVGFSSYLLIGHWHEKPSAAAAASKAFLFNRIGDAGFLIGLMLIWANTDTFELAKLFQMPMDTWSTAASLCLFCGVMGKSAQFPLLTWLPDAMEGPTPVSALIHAATMVAAGIYLLARVDFMFTPDALAVVTIVGILTALLAALAALAQFDIKKILAYSTISQLGLMVTAVGLGSTDAALIHLFTHAFFKACLFLAAGSVIHTLHRSQQQSPIHFDVQDIRNLGGLRKKLPFTFLAFVMSGCSLAGVPLFSGFLSKDAILSSAYGAGNIFFYLILIVSFLTVLYTFRAIWKVFFGEELKTRTLAFTEAPFVMRLPMAILMIASLWWVVSFNPFNYMGWLYHGLHPGKTFHFNIMIVISAAWVLLSVAVAYKIRNWKIESDVLLKAFYLDKTYLRIVGKPVITLASVVEKTDRKVIDGIIHFSAYTQVTIAYLTAWFDREIVDGLVNLMARIVQSIGSLIRSFQGGKIQLYIFWASMAIIIFLIWTLF
jgi:NADH-quinone oxidoreductase subunit L